MRGAACIPIMALTMLGACSNAPEGVIVYQRTVLGFDVSAATAQTNGQIVFGYDRDFAAVVPPRTGSDADGEAMSTLSCTRAAGNPLNTFVFAENLATGEVAVNYAKGLANGASDSIFNCFRPGGPEAALFGPGGGGGGSGSGDDPPGGSAEEPQPSEGESESEVEPPVEEPQAPEPEFPEPLAGWRPPGAADRTGAWLAIAGNVVEGRDA